MLKNWTTQKKQISRNDTTCQDWIKKKQFNRHISRSEIELYKIKFKQQSPGLDAFTEKSYKTHTGEWIHKCSNLFKIEDDEHFKIHSTRLTIELENKTKDNMKKEKL